MKAAPDSYRTSHIGRDKALSYDHDFWSPDSAKGMDWALEQTLLDRIFARHLSPRPVRAIDFACGTGRVLAYLESWVASTSGVDVSPDMIAVARQRCTRSRLVEHDVTAGPPHGLGADVQLVTAFRFFLNAEPALRLQALDWIRSVLTPDGHLVANFHLNPHSLRGTYLRMRWAGRRRIPMMSPADAQRLLADAGFRTVACYGYEFLPFRREGTHLVAVPARRRVENLLAGRPALSDVAGAFIVVAKLGTAPR